VGWALTWEHDLHLYLRRATPRQMKLRRPVALIMADYRMPQIDSIEFLEQAMNIYPGARRALLTPYADTGAAIEAINMVDLDYYLMKPWDPPEEKLYPVVDDLLQLWLASDHGPVPETSEPAGRLDARAEAGPAAHLAPGSVRQRRRSGHARRHRIGLTIEADASLYFLRAKDWSLRAGDRADDVIAIVGRAGRRGRPGRVTKRLQPGPAGRGPAGVFRRSTQPCLPSRARSAPLLLLWRLVGAGPGVWARGPPCP
jgi:CheY-like chemotaxis protein